MNYRDNPSPWRDIFLDRDGVINENRADYVKSWQEFCFLPGALEALRLLTHSRYRIFIVTNQAAVNRGLLSRVTLEEMHCRMERSAAAHGARIAGLRYCPHREDEACTCRKPRPGMLLSLADEHQIDLGQAYFIGDAITDLVAGHAAGCRTILVLTGRGREQISHPDFGRHRPRYIAQNLLDAVRWLDHRASHVVPPPVYAGTAHPTSARTDLPLPIDRTGIT